MYVLVTGCCSGIGRAICKKFKKEGWYVIGSDLASAKSEDLSEDYDKKVIDCFYNVDLQDDEQIQSMVNQIDQLDCLVNVAAHQTWKPFVELSRNDFNKILDVNVTAPFVLIKSFYLLLKKSNGNIINISSVHSVCTSVGSSIYCSSKHALVGLTKSLALELAKDGIRINCVSPGCTDTPQVRNSFCSHFPKDSDPDKIMENIGKKYPLGRIGKSSEVAEAVYFLADNNKSGNTTGINFLVDGGTSIILATD